MSQNWVPPPPPPIYAPTNIPNYLVPSIVVTLFCCQITGIVALVYAAQVNSKIHARDIQGALAASKNAKMWLFISIAAGAVWTIFWVIAVVVMESSKH